MFASALMPRARLRCATPARLQRTPPAPISATPGRSCRLTCGECDPGEGRGGASSTSVVGAPRKARGASAGWLEWLGFAPGSGAGWTGAIGQLGARIGGNGGGGGRTRGAGGRDEPAVPEANYRRSEKTWRSIVTEAEVGGGGDGV